MDDKNRTGCGASRLPEDDPGQGPTPALLDFLIAYHPGLYAAYELVVLFCGPDQDDGQERLARRSGRGRGTGLTRGTDPIGWRADVALVLSKENRSHGSVMGIKLRRFCNGTKFRYIFY